MAIIPVEAERNRGGIEHIDSLEAVRLEGDELAIMGVIDLNPHSNTPDAERLVLLDVSFREDDESRFGPYDIDGSGVKRRFDKPLLLVRQEDTPDGPITRVFEFDYDEPVELGRSHRPDMRTASETLGYKDNTKVSRRHAILKVSRHRDATVQDEGSLNDTAAHTAVSLLGEVDGQFRYTTDMKHDLAAADKAHLLKPHQADGRGWGYGEYAGRPMIARDTPINGGVYPVASANHGEALVVDDEAYPDELNRVYEQLLARIEPIQPDRITLDALSRAHSDLPGRTRRVLEEALGLVTSVLRYDLKATNQLAKNYEKIAINNYIIKGVGVCRTQALLNAYLIERLIGEGHLGGNVSVDRNLNHRVAGGHAWARYTDENGQVWIVDSAQEFSGTLEESTKFGAEWDYRRTEDLIRSLLARPGQQKTSKLIVR